MASVVLATLQTGALENAWSNVRPWAASASIRGTPEGQEFANLRVETMERDIRGDDKAQHRTIPTNNFFVSFRDESLSGMKDAAMAFVEEISASQAEHNDI